MEQELEVSNLILISMSPQMLLLQLTFGNKVGLPCRKSYIVEMDKCTIKGFKTIVFRPANQSLRAFRRIEHQMWLGHQ